LDSPEAIEIVTGIKNKFYSTGVRNFPAEKNMKSLDICTILVLLTQILCLDPNNPRVLCNLERLTTLFSTQGVCNKTLRMRNPPLRGLHDIFDEQPETGTVEKKIVDGVPVPVHDYWRDMNKLKLFRVRDLSRVYFVHVKK